VSKTRRISDALWSASQHVLAPGGAAAIRARVRAWMAEHPEPGLRLDVGCGPNSQLIEAGFAAVGVDLRPEWGLAASATQLPFAGGVFQSVWSFGLLHHLSDASAYAALDEMFRVTRPGGFIVVFDAVLPEDWRPVASFVRWLDRGPYIRRQAALEALLRLHGAGPSERTTYALTGLELLHAWIRKPNAAELPKPG
jgi:SAM-dependent methyltransferase